MMQATQAMQARPLSDLRHDNRGAVMLTGLFMALFLIGALWFIVGIGDTIVYRDRMQEATDHGAFASAAINAKGMNFIALCNLVMLVAVTIHIILGIIHDISLAVCIISWGTTCGWWEGVREMWINYFDILKPATQAIHNVAKFGSYGFPVMGLAEGLSMGKAYGNAKNGKPTVIALSPSLLSGASFSMSDSGASKKDGLTLEAQPMSLVCRRVGHMGIDLLFKTALGISGKGISGKVMDLAKTIIGDIIEYRYCNDMSSKDRMSAMDRVNEFLKQGVDAAGGGKVNKVVKILTGNTTSGVLGIGGSGNGGIAGGMGGGGKGSSGNTNSSSSSSGGGIDPGFDKFWGGDGPMTVIGPAKNGNDWFQSYSININPKMTEAATSYVNFAKGVKGITKKKESKIGVLGGFFFSQAEYFFDCDKKWSTEGCNWEGNSTFAIKWRARIRRFSIPSFSSLLNIAGESFLSDVPQYQQFKDLQGQYDLGKDIFGSSGILGMKDLKGFLGQASKRAQDELKDQATDAARSAAKGAIKNLNIPFH